MKNLKNVLLRNRIVMVIVAVLMVTALSYVSVSFARNRINTGTGANAEKQESCSWYKRRSYFSDATYTTQVGTRVWFCEGLVGTGGTVTVYYIQEECDCE